MIFSILEVNHQQNSHILSCYLRKTKPGNIHPKVIQSPVLNILV
jgi:hypothetical protein